jgi:hypothetical protein
LTSAKSGAPTSTRWTQSPSSDSTLTRVENIGANFAGYFSPSYLFVTGDRGDH